jgi:hypothetical protein
MNFATFSDSLAQAAPPAGVSRALAALWWDAKGDWDKAHQCAQEVEDDAGNWVHAYLHRKEGDASNAAGWYRRANKPHSKATLEAEWRAIVDALIVGS